MFDNLLFCLAVPWVCWHRLSHSSNGQVSKADPNLTWVEVQDLECCPLGHNSLSSRLTVQWADLEGTPNNLVVKDHQMFGLWPTIKSRMCKISQFLFSSVLFHLYICIGVVFVNLSVIQFDSSHLSCAGIILSMLLLRRRRSSRTEYYLKKWEIWCQNHKLTWTFLHLRESWTQPSWGNALISRYVATINFCRRSRQICWFHFLIGVIFKRPPNFVIF